MISSFFSHRKSSSPVRLSESDERIDTIKVLVKKSTDASNVTTRSSALDNFTSIENDLRSKSSASALAKESVVYNVDDILLQPQTGFVIVTRRQQGRQRIFINVCHHPLVGLLTLLNEYSGKVETNDVDALARLAEETDWKNRPTPFIIGSIDNKLPLTKAILMSVQQDLSAEDQSEVAVGNLGVTVDVVIPTTVLIRILHDQTGDLRDQVCMFVKYLWLS